MTFFLPSTLRTCPGTPERNLEGRDNMTSTAVGFSLLQRQELVPGINAGIPQSQGSRLGCREDDVTEGVLVVHSVSIATTSHMMITKQKGQMFPGKLGIFDSDSCTLALGGVGLEQRMEQQRANHHHGQHHRRECWGSETRAKAFRKND